MAIFGSLETVRAQTAAQSGLQKALDYVAKLMRHDAPERARLFALPAGETVRVDLADGMFAIDAAYVSKARTDVFFETHRKYIDVQAVLAGEESMEVADRSRLTLDVPYDAERDLIKYKDFTDTSVLRAREGEIMVFFPADGHMSHAVAQSVLVRKSVVKVPVG
jgi:YhcH/YjgK/YiaL family protein